MSEEKLRRLEEQKAKLYMGGGEKAVQKQHAAGKQTARERLGQLFDAGSFIETGLFVQPRCTNFGMNPENFPAEGVVTGYGTVNGRLVYAAAQDFTVAGGSLGEAHAAKITTVQEAALKVGAPIIYINDSGGARIQEGVDALAGYGKIFFNNTRASGIIPQISVIMGPCAGGAVYSPALSDFIFMVDGTSQMFITGPQVICAVTGEKVTAEALGGAATHNQKSGNAHFIAASETECMQKVRQLLGYLPQSNRGTAPVAASPTAADSAGEKLDQLIPDNPNKAYDMLEIIQGVADDGEIMEYQKMYATNIVTGFIRINGHSVGVIANQPKVMAGCLDIDASDKAARFIRMCDNFNIPLLTIEDTPGFLPGLQQEYGGIIRHGAKLLYAYSEATVPKITVIVRKAYGGAYIAMCSKHLGADLVYAWPNAEIAVMGAEGACNIIFGKEIAAAEDAAAVREKRLAEYQRTMMNPYIAAARGYVDDIILPSETRKFVASALYMLREKRLPLPEKKHGNMPL